MKQFGRANLVFVFEYFQMHDRFCFFFFKLFYATSEIDLDFVRYPALHKIPRFHLISWCVNFVKRHRFCRVSGESQEILRKLCLSAKFPHEEIRWDYGIWRDAVYRFYSLLTGETGLIRTEEFISPFFVNTTIEFLICSYNLERVHISET